MTPRRLFVALALPAAVRTSLQRLAQPLEGVTWAPPNQLHLTLRFIGDATDGQIEALTQKLSAVRVEPFLLPIEGIGSFPPDSPPRVIWVGVGRGHPRLHQLRQRVDDALLAGGLLGLDVHRFHPHITLGRCREDAPETVRRWIRSHREFGGPPFRVEGFELRESRLEPAGAVHATLHRFALAK